MRPRGHPFALPTGIAGSRLSEDRFGRPVRLEPMLKSSLSRLYAEGDQDGPEDIVCSSGGESGVEDWVDSLYSTLR